jgi:hypothetical protein
MKYHWTLALVLYRIRECFIGSECFYRTHWTFWPEIGFSDDFLPSNSHGVGVVVSYGPNTQQPMRFACARDESGVLVILPHVLEEDDGSIIHLRPIAHELTMKEV